jgi:F-type H+-transporting ATPase subunit b
MNALLSTILVAAADEDHAPHRIDQTPSKFWPEGYEIWFGGIASVAIFALLFWKAGPLVKKAMAARTARVQDELDAARVAEEEATAEAARIRQAKGDIESERARVLAEADERAEALLADGRARLDREVADLEAKAIADIASAGGRVSDELRGEIARLVAATSEQVVQSSLDDSTQQRLIEEFIANVGLTGAPR